MAADQRAGDVQAQAGAGLLAFQFQPQPHEAAEYLAAQVRAECRGRCRRSAPITCPLPSRLQADLDPRRRAGVFYRIVDQIAKDHVQVDPPADDDARLQVEPHGLGGHAIVHAHRRRAIAQQLGQFDVFILAAWAARRRAGRRRASG